MMNRLDIVIMGATGFTGRHCIPYVHKFTKSNGYGLSWGIAGRSEDKLKEVLIEMGEKIGTNLSNIPIIICDVEDRNSLLEMAQKTKLIINCVGPYILYGEKVVEACLEAATHHIDVTAEPVYIKKIQLKSESAKQKGIYIIGACGLDSIPCDLGIVYLEQNFKGILNSVVAYFKFREPTNFYGSLVNYGTWASFVENISSDDGFSEIKRIMYPNKTSYQPKLKTQILPHRQNIIKRWAVPFMSAGRTVVVQTQDYFYEAENKRPIQVDVLLVIKSIFEVTLLILGITLLLLFSKFQFGKKILLNYPGIFTLGLCRKKPPSEESIENSSFEITFLGEGWHDKDDIDSSPCNKKMFTRVKGQNPGYGTTCICAVAAAITVLTEKNKLAGNGNGGVFTPGAAFAKTSLIDILNENGVYFEIIKSN